MRVVQRQDIDNDTGVREAKRIEATNANPIANSISMRSPDFNVERVEHSIESAEKS